MGSSSRSKGRSVLQGDGLREVARWCRGSPEIGFSAMRSGCSVGRWAEDSEVGSLRRKKEKPGRSMAWGGSVGCADREGKKKGMGKIMVG